MMKQYSPPIEQLQCCLVKHQCCNFHLYGAASEQVESRQYTVVGPLTYARYGLDVVAVSEIDVLHGFGKNRIVDAYFTVESHGLDPI